MHIERRLAMQPETQSGLFECIPSRIQAALRPSDQSLWLASLNIFQNIFESLKNNNSGKWI